MSQISPSYRAPFIEIEALTSDEFQQRMFFVNLVLGISGRRTLWMGLNYETAMLRAERAALERHGTLCPPLPVWDRVLEG